MSLEIERKWRVSARADLPTPLPPGKIIQQGYLAVGKDEVRLRKKGDVTRLTIKRGAGLVRREVEVELSSAQFAALWPLTEGRRVEKVRYAVDYAGSVIEIDEFDGALKGLILAEVEFPDRDAAAAFQPPPWFDGELTGRSEWSNARLAIDGVPEG